MVGECVCQGGAIIVIMAGKNKKKKHHPLFDHPLNQFSRGDALWDDEFVEAIAKGKKPAEPINWDKILKPIDKNVIQADVEVKTYTKAIEKITAYLDACEKAVCPKHSKTPFKFFDDATWTSNGEEVKHYNSFCQGTESSPCSQCSEDSQTKNPPQKKAKTNKNELVQAKGFNVDDFVGEEDTPKKVSAVVCKWCL